ncbi:A/G-specific adenine glycosylase [Sphingorhabdus sp. IMCC26285]|uniref:Adenine DNA glycosylase n=1 Tax=Sphingorhabdus profundilacus TaxID=2509718 RepID=A0A6I4LWE8_9SPHN|nr:A/G-specific adenine glycosylase [Sphingorhabdus profundilacus]MVZ96396.1 A/G-specific adenine glycosylase [Sphingorhabdus profundilacus]
MTVVQHSVQKTGDIAALLLDRYDRHARDLPWRKRPGHGAPDPYHVWLSEIMLQQTTVAAVIPYFHIFTQRWPDFTALAACDDADVMAAWAGLGYYARARNLLRCARAVVQDHGGMLPDQEKALLSLPGIGPYTAAAIAAIAFDRRAVVVDANIERVASRLFAIATPLPRAKPDIYQRVDTITPAQRPGDFAQAMMDLGAGICSVKAPSCPICPLQHHCMAWQAGNPEAYPVKPAKKAKPVRTGTIYWVRKGGRVWLVRRPDTGMLGAMRALPDDGWNARENGHGLPPFDASWTFLPKSVSHIFTHFALEITIAVTAWGEKADPPLEGEWWDVNSLDKAGLPTLFSKAAKEAFALGET